MVIVKNSEFRGTLQMVLARVDSDIGPRSAEEWRVIQEALAGALAYAAKCQKMRAKLEARAADPTKTI